MALLHESKADPIRVEQESVVDMVADRIRAEIVRGGVPAGEPLQISRLSERLGVSHIPVREALRRLETEGLVERHQHGRGVVVVPVTAGRLRHIYRLRLAIEPDLVASSVPLLDEAALAELEALLDQLHLDDATDADAVESVIRAHHRFHRAIVEPAASGWDLRVLGMLWHASDLSVGVVFATWAHRQRNYLTREIHEPLVKAAVDRRPEEMREALITHLVQGVDQLAEALEPTK